MGNIQYLFIIRSVCCGNFFHHLVEKNAEIINKKCHTLTTSPSLKLLLYLKNPNNFVSGNNFGPQGQQLDKKSGQWFGALVKSSGDNGVILV